MKKKILSKSYKLGKKPLRNPLPASERKLLELESEHKNLIDSLREIQKSEKLGSAEIARLISLPQESIPVSVFNTDLPPLEAVVFYLNKVSHISQIAELLGRSEKTIWTTRKNSSDKDIIIDDTSRIRVPVKLLANRRFSILENITKFLKDEIGLRQIEIANLLGKDRRAVWTVYDRARKKEQASEQIAEKTYLPITAGEKRLLELEYEHKSIIDSLREIQKSEKLSAEDIARLISLPQESIPVSIFNTKLPPLEAVVYYLNKITHTKKIAELLSRSEKTIWTTRKNSSDKDIIIDDTSKLRVPVKLLADRTFSILENVIKYLKEGVGLRQIEIANMLGKDRRAVWTVYDRARKKQIKLDMIGEQ